MPSKILLAEDDANLRETLAEALRAEGYEVNAVANGQQAMDALDQPDAAAVIILDGLLPKVSGQDVAKFVRARGLDTPIIFMSGVFKSQDQQKDAKEKYGVKAYLTKPFDVKRLVDAVKPLLFQAASSSAAPAQQSPLPAEGQLLESPALYLLWRGAKELHTGVLELFGERERARVFLFKGKAVLAQHSDPQLNVGVELIREGLLDAGMYKAMCDLAVQRSQGLLEVLKSENVATDAQAKAAYKVLIPKVLERVVAFNGRFRFVATDAFTSIVPTSTSPVIEPLLAGLKKATEKQLEPHVGPRRPLRLAPGDAWADVASRLVEGCGSDSLMRAINGRATIAAMLEAASNPSERAARFRQVYLLMSTMAVQASLEVIPMNQAAQVAQQPVSSTVPATTLERAPARAAAQVITSGGGTATGSTVSAAKDNPLASMFGAASAAGVVGASNAAAPRAATASGARQASRPVIDEGADRGQMFSPEETEARAKISAKFEDIEGKDYWAIMGVKPGSDANTVKKAYFALARDFHTDAFAGQNLGSAQKKLDHVFQSIQTAY
ncbi:MAG TPA: response regulator, partial [Myxococcota bacterium]